MDQDRTYTAAVLGATGNVGGQIVTLLVASPRCAKVVVTRRKTGVFTDPNFAVNTLTTAAKPGDLLFVWGTGLGAISSSDAATPPVGDINVPVDVFVGDKKADVSYKGRSGCCSGIDQILFTVPQGVTGCYVPVVVRAGTSVSNFTTISISANGRSCSDPQGYTASDLVNAGNNAKLGFVTLTTASGKFAFPVGSAQGTIELGEAHFRNFFGNFGAWQNTTMTWLCALAEFDLHHLHLVRLHIF